ncbi:hypothetical protein RJ55_05177 [Drechmeria coniospora]|nr:hypothetical protein RJ55_05177 [Drechmeria coniospora]
MVTQCQALPLYRAANQTVDTKHAQHTYFEDEDKSVLDDTSIDHSGIDSGLELSPPMANSRRESFVVSDALFSPKTKDWQSIDMQSLPSNNPFLDQHSNSSNNPFLRVDASQSQSQSQAFGQQGNDWLMPRAPDAGAASTFPAFDSVPAVYDANVSIFHRQMQGQIPFGNAGNIFDPSGNGEVQAPDSPQKEWVTSPELANKDMGSSSPMLRSHHELRRGDGIRKKNARFEIPAERNLNNIDHLIAHSTNEQEIKELKQQKRLLRNRQAALDSRQRKKQHTERLEDEKKQYTALVTDMEEEMIGLKARVEQLLREKQSYAEYIESLTHEKDEMIQAHTIETGGLRKRVSVLTEHVQRLELNSAASVPPRVQHPLFPGDYDEMDDMAMTGLWDNDNFIGDYASEEPEIKQEMPTMPVNSSETPGIPDGDKGVSQGGLLFMLFLVGAFVMSSQSTPAIPHMSEDVRAASATLLDNVLKDAGVPPQTPSRHMPTMAPQPSGTTSWSPQPPKGTLVHLSAASSALEELGDALTQPTKEQTNEQIFSMSASQYNGLSNQDFPQNSPQRSTSQGRKNLAEALASMRSVSKQTGAADVYTRSLLWDQIPNEVVRNFAKMVAECNNAQKKQQCHERHV